MTENALRGEDVYTVIGKVVSSLLRPDHTLTLHEIINALHLMGEGASLQSIKDTCSEAIRILARQMH
ncbi:hypothetical protein [Erwinia typographi]|uniref:hypothetical protein n=1 Tax=Erwinia typographi TaxID=371042 RepID=UPI000AEC262C|nr:hypothetical protein [Erwinia typographi]